MKLKTLTTIILFCLSACFISCSDDDDNSGGNGQLPEESAEFVQKYFPANEILSTKREQIGLDNGYKVELAGDISILFYSTANWYEIQAENGLPESAKKIINESTLEELEKAEPTAKIVNLRSRYGFYYQKEIHLQLANGNQYIDAHAFGQEWHLAKISPVGKAMQPIRDFLNRNELFDFAESPGSYFSSMTLEGETVYRVTISDGLKLCFDQKGKWIYAKIGFSETGSIASKLTDITVEELPEDILEIVKKQQDKGSLQTMVCYKGDTYGFEFQFAKFWVTAAGVLDPESKIAKDFALEYLEKTDVIVNEQEAVITSPFECTTKYITSYKDEQKDKVFELLADNDGQWQSLKMEKLPQKLIDMLPANIGKELSSKYKNVNFQSVTRDPKKEEMYTFLSIEGRIYIYFDKDGKFLGQYIIINE